jgi:ABC-type nitrate/sulfonate/bicarbonate transport system ATPase subunit
MINISIDSKRYPTKDQSGRHEVIANFQLPLQTGEFVCLVGPSGCGKTTLLNTIAKLDHDYNGSIEFTQQSDPKIGYIFQNPRLLPWRTVRENIELALQDNVSADNIDAMLEAMQLSQFQHVYPERLSLGMSRRVAIIRAFAINPDLLLMDEPFVSLDVPTAKKVKDQLLKLWLKRPHTVLFVTHDLREAITLADRIVFLTAAPMRVMRELAVPILRENRNEEVIEAFRLGLLAENPELTAMC